MDRTARNKVGNIRLENQRTRAFIRYLCNLYQENRHVRTPCLKLTEFAVSVGLEATFKKSAPGGKVAVTYEILGNAVNVQVDRSQIETEHRKRIFVLNEQSASFFRKYQDSHGTELVDGQIGAWDNVKAEWACFTDAQEHVGLRLWRAKNAIFRFPPLGLGCIAASLRSQGVHVELIDCTFLTREEALAKAKRSKPQIIGFYSMFSMKKTTLELAALLRNDCELLVVGGPLPTLEPAGYLDVFDVAVLGEGEPAMTEIVECHGKGIGFSGLQGVPCT